MKTFVWPTNSQNVRSTFDWNDLESVLGNSNRTSNRSKWSFEEEQPEYRSASTPSIDPAVQQCVEYAKSSLPAIIYQIKMTLGLNDHEAIVLLKAAISGIRPIAEANMTNRLNGPIEQLTGYRIINQFKLSDQQMVQAIDLIIEFLNSKL